MVIDLATYRGRRNAVDLDRQLGFVLRRRRQQLGITQVQLARQVDIVPQQITKYERGLNRVGAARLIRLAHALDLPLDRLAGPAVNRSVAVNPAEADDGRPRDGWRS